MALYDTEFGLPQSMVDYLNQGLPSIQQPYRPGYDKSYGPKEGMGYTAVMPKPGYQYVYGPDGQRYSIPIPGYNPNKDDPQGIVSLYPKFVASGIPDGFRGGDDGGFNPFDIKLTDSSIKTPDQYSPYAYRQALEKSFVGDPNEYGYRTNTEAQKMMDNYPDYYESKPLTGIEKLLTQLPTTGGFIKAADALGDMLQDKGSIFKNELLGQGIKLDSLGRIVTDNYRTPEGIMAGYNPVSGGLLNMLTGGAYGEPTQYGLENAVAKKQENIKNTLQDKYGLSEQQIDQVLDEIEETGTYTGPLGFEPRMGKTTNLFEDLFNVGQFDLMQKKALEKSNLIFEKKLEEKQQKKQTEIDDINRRKREETDAAKQRELQIQAAAKAQEISRSQATQQQKAIERDQQRDRDRGGAGSGGGGVSASGAGSGGGYNQGNFCFDPNTPIQMANGSEKKIKDIQLGDDTKGGEVTGVFQFKASDEIHDYKGVTVAGSHYVKEDGKFIMVKDSPLSIKIDKIPVVYSLDTTGRRIFINNIEFADYNGDGIAKGFLENAGVDLAGFDKEVLRQVEHRLI
jgi:hypothetical protein